MFNEGLVKLIATTPAISTLLGTSRGDNTDGVFGVLAITNATMPYIVVARISGKPVMSFAGANKLHWAVFRITCHASGYTKAFKLAEQVKLLFASFTGQLPDTAATVVGHVEQENEVDGMEPMPHGTIYSVHMDFKFGYVDNQGA